MCVCVCVCVCVCLEEYESEIMYSMRMELGCSDVLLQWVKCIH